jgi:hypothetical protein
MSFEDLSSQLIGYFGSDTNGDQYTVTLRKRSNLKNQAAGGATLNLATSGSASAGASSLNLKGGTGSGLVGRLLAGMTFTIAGDPTVYTVTSEVYTDNTVGGILTSVPISPDLADSTVDGQAVTLTSVHVDFTFDAFRGGMVTEEDAHQSLTEETRRRLHLDPSNQPAYAIPEEQDLIIEPDRTSPIREVEKVAPFGIVQRWVVTVGNL